MTPPSSSHPVAARTGGSWKPSSAPKAKTSSGTTTTMPVMRMACTIETAWASPPRSLARIAISAMPAAALPKKAVRRSVWVSRRSRKAAAVVTPIM